MTVMWTTSPDEVLSTARRIRERNKSYEVSRKDNGFRFVVADSPPVAYLMDVTPSSVQGEWNVNAWFSDKPEQEPMMRELALTVMAGTEPPHTTTTIVEPPAGTSLVHARETAMNNESFAAENVLHEVAVTGYSLKAQYISSFVGERVPHIDFATSWGDKGSLVHGTWYGYSFVFSTRRYASILKVGGNADLALWGSSIDLSKPVGCKATPEELPYLSRMAHHDNGGWVTREGFAALFCTTARSLAPIPFPYYFQMDPDWMETVYAFTEEQAVEALKEKYPTSRELPTRSINSDPRVFPVSMPPFTIY